MQKSRTPTQAAPSRTLPPGPSSLSRGGSNLPVALPDAVRSEPRNTGRRSRWWTRELQTILWDHNDRHATKPKAVSSKTQSERAAALFRCFRDLRALGFMIRNPYCLGGRHVAALVRDWTASQPGSRRRTLSPATIQTELSHLRTFAAWIGKPGLVLPAESYASHPKLVTRRYVATADRSWPAHEVDPDALIAAIAAHDVWVGAELRLARAFGLRVKEAVMLQPRVAEKPCGEALQPSGEARSYLEVARGTKGGRARRVPIDTPAKRAALDAAKALLTSDTQYLASPVRSLKQNLDRLRNVMKRFGVTRQALGVTPHGLRHEYAADRYAALAGVAAPVRGGETSDAAADYRARLQVAEELGHGRVQITGAYLGTPRTRRTAPVSGSAPPSPAVRPAASESQAPTAARAPRTTLPPRAPRRSGRAP